MLSWEALRDLQVGQYLITSAKPDPELLSIGLNINRHRLHYSMWMVDSSFGSGDAMGASYHRFEDLLELRCFLIDKGLLPTE